MLLGWGPIHRITYAGELQLIELAASSCIRGSHGYAICLRNSDVQYYPVIEPKQDNIASGWRNTLCQAGSSWIDWNPAKTTQCALERSYSRILRLYHPAILGLESG